MKSKAVLLGHPVHPMLIPFPIAFLTGAMLFDAAGWLLGNLTWWATGGYLGAAGIATALFAGTRVHRLFVYGPSEQLWKDSRHQAYGGNAGVGGAVCNRVADSQHCSCFAALHRAGLEAAGLALVAIGGYMGGTLVTRNLISVDHRYASAGTWREATIASPQGGTVVVAQRDELKTDQMKLLRLDGRRIVLARTEDGYVAFDDRCTHRGGSLAGGVMICGTVKRLWRGSQFDVRTGAVKAGPAKNGIAV